MRGPPPSPHARRRNKRDADFLRLPGPRRGRVPSLPADIQWSEATREAWKTWWRSPQSTQWHKSDVPQLVLMARCYEDALNGNQKAYAEYRAWTDRFGLSPRGRRQLRWVIEAADEPEERRVSVVPLRPEPDDAA